MNMKSVLVVLFALSAIALSACQPATNARQVDVLFVPHVVAGMPEQDVYVAIDDDDQVVRIAPDQAEALGDAPLYAAAGFIEHDPFAVGEMPIGPFPKGVALGLTLDEWLAATGSGTYTVHEDIATLDFNFQNLIPNGIYTMWCSQVSPPPDVEIIDEPCGAADGSQNTFNADAQGNAQFYLEMPTLPDSTAETIMVLGLAYHSDGGTHGAYPGDFGLNSHVQIFYMVPGADDAAWHTTENIELARGQ